MAFEFKTTDAPGLANVFATHIKIGDKFVEISVDPKARAAQAAALGLSPEQFDFVDERAKEATNFFNDNFFAKLSTADGHARFVPNFQKDSAEARAEMGRLVELKNTEWAKKFAPPAQPALEYCPTGQQPVATAAGGDGTGNGIRGDREPGKPFPWWIVAAGGALLAAAALLRGPSNNGTAVAAAPAPKKAHDIEILDGIYVGDKEIIVLRDRGYLATRPILVLERDYKAPPATTVKKVTMAAVNRHKGRDDTFVMVETAPAVDQERTTAPVMHTEYGWLLTTIDEAQGAAVLNAIADNREDIDAAHAAVANLTTNATNPGKKRGKLVGNIIPRVWLKGALGKAISPQGDLSADSVNAQENISRQLVRGRRARLSELNHA